MSQPPSSEEPEYLSSGDPSDSLERQPRSGRRTAFIAGGVIAVGGLLVGGAMWAWAAFSSSGTQPSEVLPANTLGYASIDLDPSGQQKIEAFRILRKFPALTDEVDLKDEDDVRQKVIEEALDGNGCDLDYATDVEPWLGQRFAIAAVPGEERPSPVVVLQVSDADAADDGLDALRECGGSEESGAWEIRGEWAVVAETEEIAGDTADAADEGSLADDEDYQQLTDAAGDAGIINAYAAPEAGRVLLESLGQIGGPFGATGDEAAPDDDVPPAAGEALADFGGAALTVRFAEGALELEAAAPVTEATGYGYLSDTGGDLVATLPEDTAIAAGFGLEEGWGEAALERLAGQFGGDLEEGIALAESELGIELPEDLETAFGESLAFALSSDVDAETLGQSEDGADVPAGFKVRGEATEIEDILEKFRAAAGPDGALLGSDSEDDVVAIGPSADYRDQLLAEGDLGGSEAYEDVVREADKAGAVLFVNFDAGGWLDDLVREEGDEEARENFQPLEAFGASSWLDGDEGHALVRLTTE